MSYLRKSFIDSDSSDYIMEDRFYRKAVDMGFRARSVFKLKEIVKKYDFVKKGDAVLDLGASPGSWMQYLAGFSKFVLGIDISEVKPIPNTEFLQKSVLDEDIIDAIKRYRAQFDVVISDMAPKTCGKIEIDQYKSLELCERAFFIAQNVLKSNGNFMCKIFQSHEADEFLRELRKHFSFVKSAKPEASKSKSKEIYYVCMGFKG